MSADKQFNPADGITYKQGFKITENPETGIRQADFYTYAHGFGKVLKSTASYFTADVDTSGKPFLTEENRAELNRLHEEAVTNFNDRIASRSRSSSGTSVSGVGL